VENNRHPVSENGFKLFFTSSNADITELALVWLPAGFVEN